MKKAVFGAPFSCAPSMGAILEVQVLPCVNHSERSEAHLREGDRSWGGMFGSIERQAASCKGKMLLDMEIFTVFTSLC